MSHCSYNKLDLYVLSSIQFMVQDKCEYSEQYYCTVLTCDGASWNTAMLQDSTAKLVLPNCASSVLNRWSRNYSSINTCTSTAHELTKWAANRIQVSHFIDIVILDSRAGILVRKADWQHCTMSISDQLSYHLRVTLWYTHELLCHYLPW